MGAKKEKIMSKICTQNSNIKLWIEVNWMDACWFSLWIKWIFFSLRISSQTLFMFFPIRFNQMSSNGILCKEHKFYREWNIFAKCTHKRVRFVWSFYSHVLTARYITQRAWNAPCINLDAIKCRNVVGYKWNWKVISICAYAFHSRHHFLFLFLLIW